MLHNKLAQLKDLAELFAHAAEEEGNHTHPRNPGEQRSFVKGCGLA